VKRLAYASASVVLGVVVMMVAASRAGRLTGAAIFLGLAVTALCAVVFVFFLAARALVRDPEDAEQRVATGRRRKELEREKQALLKALKELEFDHEMGKVSDEDYQEIGANYRARAVRVLRQLDESTGDADYRALAEKELKARLEGRGAKAAEAAATPASEAAPVSPPSDKLGCTRCGARNDADADFCKKCGNRLRAEEATS
jgi:Ca2+/Na+ antiporter